MHALLERLARRRPVLAEREFDRGYFVAQVVVDRGRVRRLWCPPVRAPAAEGVPAPGCRSGRPRGGRDPSIAVLLGGRLLGRLLAPAALGADPLGLRRRDR